jgi:hypothetical protein
MAFRQVKNAALRSKKLCPQQQQDIARVMEIAKKFGLEIPPPPGALI